MGYVEMSRNIELIGEVIQIDERYIIHFESSEMLLPKFILTDGFKKVGEFTSFSTILKAIEKIESMK